VHRIAEEDWVLAYLDSGRGISANLVLGALLDAGVDIALVRRILDTITLPRIVLMRAADRVGALAGTVASVAIGPLPRGTRLLDAIRALENGRVPLAVRTWGGGMLARLLEAEAMVRGEPLDIVPLADPVTVAELLAVSAAFAALRVVRVYAAPIGRTEDSGLRTEKSVPRSILMPPKGHPQSAVLLAEAGWSVASDAFVTPGGAAILAALAEPGVPPVRLSAVGYGIAADAPHLLRCWLGMPYNAGTMPTPSGTRIGAATHAHPHSTGDEH